MDSVGKLEFSRLGSHGGPVINDLCDLISPAATEQANEGSIVVIQDNGDFPTGSLFVGNHGSVAGIGDWIRLLGMGFAAEGLELALTSALGDQHLVVLLDEFSKRATVDSLIQAQHGAGRARKYVVALSEFMDVDRSLELRLNPFERWYSGVGLHQGRLLRTARGLRAAVGRERYMRMRAAGLQEVLHKVRIDLVLAGHPAISQALAEMCDRWGVTCPPRLDILHPAMCAGVWVTPAGSPRPVGLATPATQFTDDLSEGTRDYLVHQYRHLMPIVGQGHDTPYRQEVDRTVGRLGIPQIRIPDLQLRPPDSLYWGLDLVVPRSRDWPYLSPFRLLRAHSLGLIPVMLNSWAPKDGSPWESLVLRVESLEELAALRLSLDTRYLRELTDGKRAMLEVDVVRASAAWSEAMSNLGIRRPPDLKI